MNEMFVVKVDEYIVRQSEYKNLSAAYLRYGFYILRIGVIDFILTNFISYA